MNITLFLAGTVLLVVAITDLLWTTLWVDRGAGPLTSRLTAWGWEGLQKGTGAYTRLIDLAGPLLIGLALLTWIILLWVGWTCLFASGENALQYSQNGRPVTWTGHLYFVGYTLFTLGIGDITPSNGFWQIATILATANGMLFVTMSVSFVISVLGAVTLKRSFASTITGLGMRGEAVVRSGWNGENFRGLDPLLSTLAARLERLTYQHQAYPILHYYHSHKIEHSAAVSTAVFDEALTILRFGIPEEYRPESVQLASARSSVWRHLDTLHSVFMPPAAEESPPFPDLDLLRDAGIPTVSDEKFESALEGLEERRQRLLGLVQEDAREWPRNGGRVADFARPKGK